jgi:hypothetical protein
MNHKNKRNQYLIKFRMNRTRNGTELKMFTADSTGIPFTQQGIVFDGITDMKALERALKTQLDFVLDEIMSSFKGAVSDAPGRVEAIRIKERNYTRARRDVGNITVNGGGKPERKKVTR